MRYKETKLASIFGILGNAFLLIIKLLVAFITGSKGILADAMNSLGDIVSSIMTYIGNKIASMPSDDDHNLGYGKAEYIYSLLISIIMTFIAFMTFKESIVALFKREIYVYSNWLIVVCIVTILIKTILYLYTNKISKKHNNLLLKANAKDHINDTLVTSFNLISSILAYYNIFYFDSIIGMSIAIYIFISAYNIFIESYNVLMDKSIDIETKNKVLEIVNKHKEIKKTIHFNSTPVGFKYQISLTIFVDGNLKTFKSHEIADSLEKEIIDNIEEIYLAVIHVNPI